MKIQPKKASVNFDATTQVECVKTKFYKKLVLHVKT